MRHTFHKEINCKYFEMSATYQNHNMQKINLSKEHDLDRIHVVIIFCMLGRVILRSLKKAQSCRKVSEYLTQVFLQMFPSPNPRLTNDGNPMPNQH